MNEILLAVFLYLVIAMLCFLMTLIIINLYGIFEEPAIQERIRKLRKSSQPWVTVLLYARNNEASIETSLNALIKNKYDNYDIVVVDDRSADSTARQVKQFIQAHPKYLITLVRRKKRTSLQLSLEAGYKKSKNGSVIISLLSTTVVTSEFIKRAVATKRNQERAILRIYDPVSVTTLSGIVRSLSDLLWLHSHTAIVSDPEHITPVKLEVRLDLLSIALLLGILFVSIITKDLIVVWFGWVIITSFLCAVIWLKFEGLNTKIKLTFSALSALFLLPVASFVQAISQFRSRI